MKIYLRHLKILENCCITIPWNIVKWVKIKSSPLGNWKWV